MTLRVFRRLNWANSSKSRNLAALCGKRPPTILSGSVISNSWSQLMQNRYWFGMWPAFVLQWAFNRHHDEACLFRHAFPRKCTLALTSHPRFSPSRLGGILLDPLPAAGFRRGDSAWESIQFQRRIWTRTHPTTFGQPHNCGGVEHCQEHHFRFR
jgi:hypothetical protein